MTKIAIQYGIFGGPKRGVRLLKALRAAGYEIIMDAESADIVICHSAGCFWLPSNQSAQLILIDPPYWPGKTIQQRSRARARSNQQYKRYGYTTQYWTARNSWGIYYGIRDAKRTLQIMRFAEQYNLPATIKNRTVLIIRNEHDDWLSPDFEQLKLDNPLLQTITVPGDHDDCMYNPAPYMHALELL